MKRIRLLYLLIVLLVIGIPFYLLHLARSPSAVDHFSFLGSLSPFSVDVGQVVSGPSGGDYAEERTYRIVAKFDELVSIASQELKDKGFFITRKDATSVAWDNQSRQSGITIGFANVVEFKDKSTIQPINIYCNNTIPSSWWTFVRVYVKPRK